MRMGWLPCAYSLVPNGGLAVDVMDKAAPEGALADFCASNVSSLDMMELTPASAKAVGSKDVPYEAAVRDVNFKAVLTGATPHCLTKSTGKSDVLDVVTPRAPGMPRIARSTRRQHAVKGLTEALSVEWQRHGVRVAGVLRSDRHPLSSSARQHSDERPLPRSPRNRSALPPRRACSG